jgi:pyruvate kinase
MLNKGRFIRETLRFLADVLRRMEEHQYKKRSRLRKLKVARRAADRKPATTLKG